MIIYTGLKNDLGYLGRTPTKQLYKYMNIDDKVYEIHTVMVHRFNMSDAEDPDLYAAQPILDWQNTEKGKWVMANAMEVPMWHRQVDTSHYGWTYAITAKLKGPDFTFYTLKWGQNI